MYQFSNNPLDSAVPPSSPSITNSTISTPSLSCQLPLINSVSSELNFSHNQLPQVSSYGDVSTSADSSSSLDYENVLFLNPIDNFFWIHLFYPLVDITK